MNRTSMLRFVILVVVNFAATGAWAQTSAPAPATVPPDATATSAPPAKAVVPMEEPLPGDHWTYEIRDEITGTITATRENVVTEVTPTEISVRYKKVGTSGQGLNVYDRSWNVLVDRPWRYSPNDGTGIQSPLTVGKSWPVQTNNINSANGSVWKRSGIAKVIGQESITTKAGTFDTFKIEIKFTGRNVNNPMMKNEVTSLTWYAPAIDHWVKRTFASRADKHLQIDTAVELVEYGRKQ
jgi:hypothetical protein